MRKGPAMLRSSMIAAALMLSFAACLCAAQAGDSLYHDLGERAGITQIIDKSMVLFLADDRIKDTFSQSNIPRLKGMLVDFIQKVSGGPDVYKGANMKAAHRELHLTNADFNALVEDLQTGMDESGVSFATQNRLLAILAPMQRDVVTR